MTNKNNKSKTTVIITTTSSSFTSMSTIILLFMILFMFFMIQTNGGYLFTPRSNIYNGVHIRNNRHDLTGIYPTRHSRPRPYRGYPYGQPDPMAAHAMARYSGEWDPVFGYNVENSAPEVDLRTINRFRPRARFW